MEARQLGPNAVRVQVERGVSSRVHLPLCSEGLGRNSSSCKMQALPSWMERETPDQATAAALSIHSECSY